MSHGRDDSSKRAILLRLAIIFFRIGAFTFGGGFAMIPLIKVELVDKNGWMTEEEFMDAIAVTQGAPGPIAVNVGVYTGWNLAGIWGAVVSALFVTLPSFITILVIAIAFAQIKDNPLVGRIFDGINAAVVAMVLQAAYSLGQKVLTNRWMWGMFAVIMVVLFVFNVHPALVIILAGLGYLLLPRQEVQRA